MNLNFDETNIQEELENIGDQLTQLFTGGLPAQLPDKVQNFTTGLSEALRIYGDIRQRLGAAIEMKDVIGAKKAVEDAKFFLEDTVAFLKASSGVDDFRKNSYIWAKKHCSPEAAASMGVTDGTPDDYQ